MKHLFLPAALLCVASAQAQTTPGTLLLSGTVGYSSTKTETSATQRTPSLTARNSQFSFTPRVGGFVANNLAVGLHARLDLTKAKQPEYYYYGSGVPTYLERTEKNTGLQLGPFVRYYHMLGDKAGFYGQLAGGYSKSKSKVNYPNQVGTGTTFESSGGFADLTPGFVFFPTDKFGLELTLGSLAYSSMKSQMKDAPSNAPETTTSYLEARFGLSQLMLGASFYLGGK